MFKPNEKFMIILITSVFISFLFELYVVSFVLAMLFIYVDNKRYYKLDTREDIIDTIRQLSPREFESFCCELLSVMGYWNIKLTPPTNDGGRDIEIGKEMYVECKKYEGCVGREILQKLIGASEENHIRNCMVITTGRFTNSAYECMRRYKRIKLIDMNGIMKIIEKNNADVSLMIYNAKEGA